MPRKKPKKGKDIRLAHSKQVRTEAAPTDHERVSWGFARIDWNGPWSMTTAVLENLVKNFFPSVESMTWAEISRASGGRRTGNNHHSIEVKKLSKAAKLRLEEIHQDDVDCIFSLRVSAVVRIYGIRDGRQFQILWYDPCHDQADKAVCPVKKR